MKYGEFREHALSKWITEYRVMGNYGIHGWEVEDATTVYRDHKENFRAYLENGPGEYRTARAQVLNPDYGRFFVGQHVKVNEETTEWARGFRSGHVRKIGYRYVTVQWDENDKVSAKFWTYQIAPIVTQ